MKSHRQAWYCGGIAGLTLAAWCACASMAPAQTLQPKKSTSKDTVKKDTVKKDTAVKPAKAVVGVNPAPVVKAIVLNAPVVWSGVIPGTNIGVSSSIYLGMYSPLGIYNSSLYSSLYAPSYPYLTPMSSYQQYPQLPNYNTMYNMYPANPFVNATPAFQPYNPYASVSPFDLTVPNGLSYRAPVFPAFDGFGSVGGGLGFRPFGY